ncbi:MAG: NmrA family NAD(P)-binding protein [Bacteroidota bacterium]
MKRVLVTGATGTVGREVIRSLRLHANQVYLVAGVRKSGDFRVNDTAEEVRFDFDDSSSFDAALQDVDTLFLLRPPQISQAKKYFEPIISVAQKQRVKHIVFLSVQGADTNSVIPHHIIEELIKPSGIDYTFLRPAYFMQNFLTTLRKDLVEKHRVFLPAGKAKLTVVDVRDIGRVAAKRILHSEEYRNQAYDLTNQELLGFGDMAQTLTEGLEKPIRYESPNLLKFFITKKKQGIATSMVLVMTMLHYLPRFSSPPPLSDWVQKITGQAPYTFEQFVNDHRDQLLQ